MAVAKTLWDIAFAVLTAGRLFQRLNLKDKIVSTDGVQICVDPAIPDSCLGCLAGWLLRNRLESEPASTEGAAETLFLVTESENTYHEIDDAFVKYFNETSANDPLKAALILENEDLAGVDGLEVGEDIATFGLRLEDILQCLIRANTACPEAIEVMVLCTARFIRPGNIGAYCAFITANDIMSTSLESWFAEKRTARRWCVQ